MEPRKQNLTDLPRLFREIKADVGAIGESLQPLARNWGPLLVPTKNFVAYLSSQLKLMSDPQHNDPSMENFTREVESALDKLKPMIEELSTGNRRIPQLLGNLHIVLEQMPKNTHFLIQLF